MHLSQEVLDGNILVVTSLNHLKHNEWDEVRTRKTLFIPEGQLGMVCTKNAFRTPLSSALGPDCQSYVTLQVLAGGEALVRREHRPLLHWHPAGHADQTRLQVYRSQSRRGWWRRRRKRGGENRNRVEGNESGGCNKEDGDREGGGGMNDGVRGRGKK